MKAVPATVSLLLLPALFCPPASGDPVDPALQDLLLHPVRIGESSAGARLSDALPLALQSAVSPADPERLGILVEMAPGRSLPLAAVHVVPLTDTQCAAYLTLEEVRSLLDSPDVTAVRLARPMRPLLDRSNAFLGVSRLRDEDPDTGDLHGLTGRGVIVGIVDSGVDWSHPDFQDETGATRILYYWDQVGTSWLVPEDYGFGSEYTPYYIDRGIAGGFDRIGHGTHVLGIAAGNGRGSLAPDGSRLYTGVAPEASIIAVKTDFTDLGVAVGAFYIFDRAASLGRPAVVNVSLGSAYGPHRGTTPVDLAMMRMSGPGKIVVAAAGNEGDADQHAEFHLATGETARLPVTFPAHTRVPGSPAYLALEGWFPAGNRYRFALVNPGGQIMTRMVLGDYRPRAANNRGEVRGWYAEDLGMTTLFFEIADSQVEPGAAGTWSLDVEALEVGDETELDFWITGAGRFGEERPRFTDHVDAEETVLTPASAHRVVAVGAVSTRSCWTDARGTEHCYAPRPAPGSIAPFSALGPTSDGRVKPEVLAPGFGIISARSSTISGSVFTSEELAILTVPGLRYWVAQGTSMAAPQVTGTAALLLSKYPTMTPEQLVTRLTSRSEAVTDPRTGRRESLLRTWDAVQPVVSLALGEATVEPQGNRIRWLPTKEREPVSYLVHRAFAREGPYHLLTPSPLRGEGPTSVLDAAPEPGRVHYYRIAGVDPSGLADDLDTLAVTAGGAARVALLPPEPNPAREAAVVRFLAPPDAAAGEARLEVLDVAGRLVTEAARVAVTAPGSLIEVTWNLRDATGSRVGAGVYFLRFSLTRNTGVTESAVRRLVVLP